MMVMLNEKDYYFYSAVVEIVSEETFYVSQLKGYKKELLKNFNEKFGNNVLCA